MRVLRRFFLPLLGWLVLASLSSLRATETSNAYTEQQAARTDELVGVDVQRVSAQLSGDVEALERIFASELTYGHSDGRLEAKADMLAGIRTGRQRYHAISPGERRVRMLSEDAAVITGTADLLVGPTGSPVKLQVRYLAVYQRKIRLGWQLVAYQSTRLPAAD